MPVTDQDRAALEDLICCGLSFSQDGTHNERVRWRKDAIEYLSEIREAAEKAERERIAAWLRSEAQGRLDEARSTGDEDADGAHAILYCALEIEKGLPHAE